MACAAELPRIADYCLRCALPLPMCGLCGRCQIQPPPYTRCISPLIYGAPISRLIAHFKYGGKLAYGRLLSGELLRRLQREASLDVDLLMPVPLHWRRRWARGFNQAEIIGDELSRALNLPLRTRWLTRVRPTPPQQSLSASERRKNLRSAFVLRASVAGLRIALIDDVVTTGATVGEIAQLLLNASARSVQVWCLARTP
ncbi:MAG TPA: phosphoribosyltransferase family protein [Spongiibacteraceae bacterium]|nr:phosphoribosyltransferase family protein [Spongiibacteraceae bacterium]